MSAAPKLSVVLAEGDDGDRLGDDWPMIPDAENVARDEGSLNEDSLARLFAEQHAGQLLFDHVTGSWFVWSGTHWRREEKKLAFHQARLLCRQHNRTHKPKIAAAATAGAVERYARADPAFAVTAERFDADPWLLGTPTGVVDLRTGEIRRASPDDYISKQTAVGLAPPGAGTPLWRRFISEACGNDAALVAYLQRVAGYSLTGDTREHALLFVYGPGGNGKSVFLNTIASVMGDYAQTAAMDSFTASRGERHPTELAMLKGARLVTAAETEEGRAWAEARIKALTGGDPISARFMRRDFFSFRPEFKLVIVGNHKPVLRSVDEAARRRFHIVPFTCKPACPDKQLEAKLRDEWPAILRWMTDGTLAWQRDGLAPPDAVIAATHDYFDDQDLLSHWLDGCCNVGANRKATHAELYCSWSRYALDNGDAPGSAKSFTDMMRRRGFESVRKIAGESVRGFSGLDLKPLDVSPQRGDR
jgi:putative DNA primase/helicase